MKKRIFFGLILILVLSTYSLHNNSNFTSNYDIKKVIIENNFIINKKEIENKLFFLYEKNLFFLKTFDIETKLKEINFIESFEIKKIYPNIIKIKISEKKPIAVIQNKKLKSYFTNKGDTINYIYLEQFNDLPLVYGDKQSFKFLINDLKNIKFPINKIKTFYLFETSRWDLITRDNITLKLPIKNYKKSLINFLNLKNKSSFKKYKIFDYRISGQLILK